MNYAFPFYWHDMLPSTAFKLKVQEEGTFICNVILMLEKIAFNSFPVSQVLIKNGQYKHNSKIINVIMKITFVKVSL